VTPLPEQTVPPFTVDGPFFAPATDRHALAARLAKASCGAPILLNLEVPGMYDLTERLRDEGIAVV